MIDCELEMLLPHRKRMLLVQDVIEIGETSVTTSSKVKPEWPLFGGGSVSSLILIELAAQTAGVKFGWSELQSGGSTEGKLGWIVGIKKADFFIDKIPENACIIVNVAEQTRHKNYAEIISTAMVDNKLIGQFEIQVFEPGEK